MHKKMPELVVQFAKMLKSLPSDLLIEVGHCVSTLLDERGFSDQLPTVAMQAKSRGLEIIKPDTNRGQYLGLVVAGDHRAVLIKHARGVVELAFKDLPDGQIRPGAGDTVRMKFKDGVLAVSMMVRAGRKTNVITSPIEPEENHGHSVGMLVSPGVPDLNMSKIIDMFNLAVVGLQAEPEGLEQRQLIMEHMDELLVLRLRNFSFEQLANFLKCKCGMTFDPLTVEDDFNHFQHKCLQACVSAVGETA